MRNWFDFSCRQSKSPDLHLHRRNLSCILPLASQKECWSYKPIKYGSTKFSYGEWVCRWFLSRCALQLPEKTILINEHEIENKAKNKWGIGFTRPASNDAYPPQPSLRTPFVPTLSQIATCYRGAHSPLVWNTNNSELPKWRELEKTFLS